MSLNDQVRDEIIDGLLRLDPAEREAFFAELAQGAARKERRQKSPWPRTVKMYLHQCKESGWSEGEEVGLDMEKIGPWCPLYEVEFHVEVQVGGDTKIVACDGFMIDYTKPFEGEIFKPESD